MLLIAYSSYFATQEKNIEKQTNSVENSSLFFVRYDDDDVVLFSVQIMLFHVIQSLFTLAMVAIMKYELTCVYTFLKIIHRSSFYPSFYKPKTTYFFHSRSLHFSSACVHSSCCWNWIKGAKCKWADSAYFILQQKERTRKNKKIKLKSALKYGLSPLCQRETNAERYTKNELGIHISVAQLLF